jgi:hypothetical protein
LTLAEFRAEMLAAGYDEVLERPWPADAVVGDHSHPFEAKALVIAGEMWLAIDGAPARHLVSGDWFDLAAGVPHTERYGAAGATYWVARKGAA